MNRYKIYFTDGTTKEVSAINTQEAEWKILMQTSRPASDIQRITII